jgi:hypothetical protein
LAIRPGAFSPDKGKPDLDPAEMRQARTLSFRREAAFARRLRRAMHGP